MIILILFIYFYTIKNYILHLNQASGVIIKMIELIWQMLASEYSNFVHQIVMYSIMIDPDFLSPGEVSMLGLGWTPPPAK